MMLIMMCLSPKNTISVYEVHVCACIYCKTYSDQNVL